MEEQTKYYTVPEASREIGYATSQSLYLRLYAGRIQGAKKQYGYWLIPEAAVAELKERFNLWQSFRHHPNAS